MLGSLYNLQDRRLPEKEERPLDWDGSCCYPALDMRGSRWEPQWLGRYLTLSSQETPGSRDQMCDTLVSGLHWMEGAGYADILEFVDHHFVYRDYFFVGGKQSKHNFVLGEWLARDRRSVVSITKKGSSKEWGINGSEHSCFVLCDKSDGGSKTGVSAGKEVQLPGRESYMAEGGSAGYSPRMCPLLG